MQDACNYGDLYYELPATKLLNCPPGGGGRGGDEAGNSLVGGRKGELKQMNCQFQPDGNSLDRQFIISTTVLQSHFSYDSQIESC